MCAALVLATRESSSSAEGPEVVELRGRTSSGFPITVFVVDGNLNGFDTRVRVTCPQGGTSAWRWWPYDGAPAPFYQDGSRFYVRERSDHPDADPPSNSVGVMRGELDDSGRVARGTIRSRVVWGSGADALACDGRASFSTRGEAQ